MAWSRAQDDRDLGCIGRNLAEGCKRGDGRACDFAGRMSLDGHGLPRDVERAIHMLATACDDDIAEACAAAVAWLTLGEHARAVQTGSALHDRLDAERSCLAGQGDSCFQVGLGFYGGQGAFFPQNHALAAPPKERGCSVGGPPAGNNNGAGVAYGHRTPRDMRRATLAFERACGLGEASGCLHAEMMAAGPPEDPARALALWQRACDANDGRACAFVGIMYVDGPDGFSRDMAKGTEAMNRGCRLDNRRACEWSASHTP